MNFQLIKLIFKLKNASLAKKESFTIPYNSLCIKLLNILYKEGLILSFNTYKEVNKTFIKIIIRYHFNNSALKNIKFISKPSRLKYLKLQDLYKIKENKRILFLSTSIGFLTSLECKRNKVGGKILFIC